MAAFLIFDKNNVTLQSMYFLLQVTLTHAAMKGYFRCTKPIVTICHKNPKILYGSFDCTSNSNIPIGDACYLNCEDGFYPAFSTRAVCTLGKDGEPKWSHGNLACCDCQTWNEWNGHEYKFIGTHYSWAMSHELCQHENASLVTIGNDVENEFVNMVLLQCFPPNDKWGCWIGLHERVEEGEWEWSDNTSVIYTHWDQRQPVDTGNLDCAYMKWKTSKWHTLPCHWVGRYAFCKRGVFK